MNYSFEYIDIILLAMIAGFIFKIKRILGKRTGFEGKAAPQFNEVLKKAKVENFKNLNLDSMIMHKRIYKWS